MTRTPRLRARCLESRYIGDDYYGAGNVYRMDGERARKYAGLGYFELLDPLPDADGAADAATDAEPDADADDGKMADAPPNKMRGRADNKGWKNTKGQTVELDGTVLEEAPDDEG